MCVPRNGIYWVRKPQGALLQTWLFVLVVVGRSVTVGRIVEPTYGLTARDQPGLLRAAGDPWPCSYQAHMARADTQLLHTLHVTNTMLCLEHEITCLMLAELSPIPSLLQPLRSLSQKNSCKIILMMMMMQMILTGGKGRVIGGGGVGRFNHFLPSRVLPVWILEVGCVGVWCDCHLFPLTTVHLKPHSWTHTGLPISQQLGLSANQAPAWLPTAGKVKQTAERTGSREALWCVVVMVRERGRKRQLKKEGRKKREHKLKAC